MDNRKFEQLIELIINENEEQARALFHDIVVEKSREIYESIMDEEAMAEDMSGDLLDEIGSDIASDEEGMSEEEDEFADIEIDDEDGLGDEDMGGEEDLEDRVVDLEDKLDQLMAEFEELMGAEEEEGHDFGGDEDMGDEDMGDEMMEARHNEEEDDEEDVSESAEDDEEAVEESLEESVQLKKVAGLYDSKIGGDDGAQSKSPALTKPKVTQTGAKPVNFSGESTTGGTKGGLASPDTKDVEHASQWKNRPAQGGMNLEKAPKAHTAQATGTNTKSPVAESKKVVKKKIK